MAHKDHRTDLLEQHTAPGGRRIVRPERHTGREERRKVYPGQQAFHTGLGGSHRALGPGRDMLPGIGEADSPDSNREVHTDPFHKPADFLPFLDTPAFHLEALGSLAPSYSPLAACKGP